MTKKEMYEQLGTTRYQYIKQNDPESYAKWLDMARRTKKARDDANFDQRQFAMARAVCMIDSKCTCSICGLQSDRNRIHHIIPVTSGGSNEQSNLMCLCNSCHQLVHKEVYFISPEDKSITVNTKRYKPFKNSYSEAYENIFNVKLYGTTGHIFYFEGIKRITITCKEMKEKLEAAGYKKEVKKYSSTNIHAKTVKKCKELARYYKDHNNISTWHVYAKKARKTDYSEDEMYGIEVDWWNNIGKFEESAKK